MMKILIDGDPGVDDSIAILHALRRPDVRVLGITTGFGNTSAAQGAENALRLVSLAKPPYEVPVAVGAEHPLVGKAGKPPVKIHGENGIAGALLPPSDKKVLDIDAVSFLLQTIKAHPHEVTIVALGRLTNLALAIKKEPNLPHLVKELVIMGGCVQAAGNITPVAEANIGGDPEAADIVLSAGFTTTVVGLDVTMKTRLRWSDICTLEACNNKDEDKNLIAYLKTALRFYMNFNGERGLGMDECPVHDPLAMLAAIDPSLFTYKKWKAHVECQGTYTRGQIVVDKRNAPFDGSWVTFCMDVEQEAAIHQLLSVFMPDGGYIASEPYTD